MIGGMGGTSGTGAVGTLGAGTGGTFGTGAGAEGVGWGSGLAVAGVEGRGGTDGTAGGIAGWARGGSGVAVGEGEGGTCGRWGMAKGNVEGGAGVLPGGGRRVVAPGATGIFSGERPLERELPAPRGGSKPGGGGGLSKEVSFFRPPNRRWNKPGRFSASTAVPWRSLRASELPERNQFNNGRLERLDLSLPLVEGELEVGGGGGRGMLPPLPGLSFPLDFWGGRWELGGSNRLNTSPVLRSRTSDRYEPSGCRSDLRTLTVRSRPSWNRKVITSPTLGGGGGASIRPPWAQAKPAAAAIPPMASNQPRRNNQRNNQRFI